MRFSLAMIPLAAALLASPVHAADPVSTAASAVNTVLGGGPAQNFLGTPGLLLTPSAYTVGQNGLAAHGYGGDGFSSFGATYGIFKNLEVGATYVDGHHFGDSGVLANAKYNVVRESTFLPAFSVGVIDAFNQLGGDPSWYVVASKDLNRVVPLHLLPLRVHLGYGAGVFDKDVFAGAELGLGTPLDVIPVAHPRFSAIAEYAHQDVNVGLRARWRGLGATLALFDFDRFGGGLTYTTRFGR